MTGVADPFKKLGTGELANTSTPVAIEDPLSPETVFIVATKEQVQDAAAELFVNGTHVNMTIEYDDEGNAITMTANASSTITNPDDISDAVAALDGAIN